jgi:hypothetical protein
MAIINYSILFLISVLHLLIIFFVICVPFSNNNYLLLLHIIIVPFIILHWYLNNNSCSLTIIEKFIKDKSEGQINCDDDYFSYKLIAPIYDFKKNTKDFSNFTYIITIGLWFVSIYSIICKIKNKEINTFFDLFANTTC